MRFNLQTIMVTVTIGIIAISAPAFAQDAAKAGAKPGQHQGKQKASEKMLAKLELTQEQKDKIKAIQDAVKAKLKPIQENNKLTAEQKKDQMKPLVKDGMKQIMMLLTPEQKTKLKELRKERQEKKAEKTEKPAK